MYLPRFVGNENDEVDNRGNSKNRNRIIDHNKKIRTGEMEQC